MAAPCSAYRCTSVTFRIHTPSAACSCIALFNCAALRMQGIVREFYPSESISTVEPWPMTFINGLWSLLLSLALLVSCLSILSARSWRLGRGWLRGFLADYGVPLMVVLWSGVSFAVMPAPHVPRRVATPNTWEVRGAAPSQKGSIALERSLPFKGVLRACWCHCMCSVVAKRRQGLLHHHRPNTLLLHCQSYCALPRLLRDVCRCVTHGRWLHA
jgi:hypothetical protein